MRNRLTNSSVSAVAGELAARVDADRLVHITMSLLELPSPSGQEGAVAERYGGVLEEAGLDVVIDREFPESPTVIARLRGGVGRTLQFDGHTDTVAQPHRPPAVENGEIIGRGAADMKAGLAAMAEAARILSDIRGRLGGGLLVTAHGQHEDPVPPHELHAPMFAMFRDRVVGDAAIIAEGPSHDMVVAGKGLCVFDLSFVRAGEPVHEVMWRDQIPNPIMAAHRFLQLLEERARTWQVSADPLLGPETYFVGAIEAGDYFNRIPVRCRVQGSRRYPAERSYDDVVAELRALGRQVEDEFGLQSQLETMPSGQGFRIDPGEPIVRAVSQAYAELQGRDLPLAGMSLIGNASQFNTIARVPTVYHGVDQRTAHSGHEHVAIGDVVRTAQVLIAATVHYLGVSALG